MLSTHLKVYPRVESQIADADSKTKAEFMRSPEIAIGHLLMQHHLGPNYMLN